jgi:hypothetical protein
MTEAERDERWLRQRPAIRDTVNGWMARAYYARPGVEVTRLDTSGRRKRPAPANPNGGPPVQQSLDDTVQWVKVNGGWDVELPWQVVNKLRRTERVSMVQVAERPGRDGKETEEQWIARRLRHAARIIEEREEAGGRSVPGFWKSTAQFLRGLAARYLDMPVAGVKVHTPRAGVSHSFYYLSEPLPRDAEQAAKHWAKGMEGEPNDANYEQNWRMRLMLAGSAHEPELAWAADMALKGQPTRITNFYIRPLFLLRGANGVNRRFADIHVGTRDTPFEGVDLDGDALSGAQRLRKFLADHASGVVHGGDGSLHPVCEDLAWHLDNTEVWELSAFGWHLPVAGELGGNVPKSEAWFTRGACCDFQGRWHRPNKHGVFNVPTPTANGVRYRRYRLSEVDVDGFPFKLQPPEWDPDFRAKPAEIRAEFRTICDQLYRMVGGWDALMAIGLTCGYGASPEHFAKHGEFPGLWSNGQPYQGKTKVTVLLASFYGFSDKGLDLEGTTPAGLESALTQYSSLPMVLEEFQSDLRAQVMTALKNAFNRFRVAKQTAGGGRTPMTTPLVVGQATSEDGATRSRYLHMTISANRRMGTETEQQATYDAAWASRHRLVRIGQFILTNRKAYVEAFERHHNQWMNDPVVRAATNNKRAQTSYGVAWAGLNAMLELLGDRRDLGEMKQWLMGEMANSVDEVAKKVELVEYLTKLATAIGRGWFSSHGHKLASVFQVRQVGYLPCPPPDERGQIVPTAAVQKGWEQWELLILPDAMHDLLQEYCRLQSERLPLGKSDLRSQLRQWKCWASGKQDRKWFAGGERAVPYWSIRLDDLPVFGYRPMRDSEYRLWKESERWQFKDGRMLMGVWATEEETAQHPDLPDHVDDLLFLREDGGCEWVPEVDRSSTTVEYIKRDRTDPRQGPLYQIVRELTKTEVD